MAMSLWALIEMLIDTMQRKGTGRKRVNQLMSWLHFVWSLMPRLFLGTTSEKDYGRCVYGTSPHNFISNLLKVLAAPSHTIESICEQLSKKRKAT